MPELEVIAEDIAGLANYSGIYNGFRHIIADKDTPVNIGTVV